MGGRGASSSSGRTGGAGSAGKPLRETSLISAREHYQREVDQALTVMRDVEEKYGVILNDSKVVELEASNRTMGYYDSAGNFAINEKYFNEARLNRAFDDSNGYHPKRGAKTGVEALTAHEIGHAVTEEIGRKTGRGDWQLNAVSNDIVSKVSKKMGKTPAQVRQSISGYAKSSNVEALAEAFADVYCNGKKAAKASIAIVNEIDSYFK